MSTYKRIFLDVLAPAPGEAPELVSFDLGDDFDYSLNEHVDELGARLLGGSDNCDAMWAIGGVSDTARSVRRTRPYMWTAPLKAAHRLFFFTPSNG